MTLILTVITRDTVVQASDRRLTIPNQGPCDDEANKTVCVSCQDAAFCIAYTGLAVIGGNRRRTDLWLLDTLTSMQAGCRSVRDVCELLQSAAGIALSQTIIDRPEQKRLTFVLAGFRMGQGFLASISNQEDEDMKLLRCPTCSFQTRLCTIRRDARRCKALVFASNGSETALDIAKPRLRKLYRKRFFQKANSDSIAAELVMLIRAAALSPSAKGYIGRSCMTSSLRNGNDQGFNCNYHPGDAKPQIYMPHFVFGESSLKDIEIWPGDVPPPWWQA